MMRILPLAILAVLMALAAWKLAQPDAQPMESRLVGKMLPQLEVEPVEGQPAFAPASGEPYIVNLFASWCEPCIIEAPILLDLAQRGIPIHGIAVRDEDEALSRFIADHGDPFASVGADPDSQAMLNLGASGVPETYLVDAQGIVRAHHAGPLAPADAARFADLYARLRQ